MVVTKMELLFKTKNAECGKHIFIRITLIFPDASII